MSKGQAGFLYLESHEWVHLEGEFCLVGISEYAQSSLGSIVFVDLPSVGDTFKKGDVFGAIESVKAASDLIMPITGEIVEVNELLSDEPELINNDAYGHYIIKVKPSNQNEFDQLLSFDQYKKIIS